MIQNNVSTIEAAKAKPTAIQAMASRLNISPGKLQQTLISTVFKGATEEEFAALVVVANELELNPLKKEIYAFPSRGGVTPMIAYDGWISITNRHPMFDGCEQNEVFLDGKFVAVETVIHRKDRSFPIKKTIYHDEFKMNTDPWKQKPMHMTAMRSFCHAARLALGVSGVLVEDEYVVVENDNQPEVVPTSRQLKADAKQAEVATEAHDPETGELFGKEEPGPWNHLVKSWREGIAEGHANLVQKEFDHHRDALPDAIIAEIEQLIADASAA
ncbi:MAG: RecT family recombinase [Casimicrobium sp.]